MKYAILFIFFLCNFNCKAQISEYELVRDTIDYENKRLYIDIPESSMKFATKFITCEGFSVDYPIIGDQFPPGVLSVDYSFMKHTYILDEECDVELWNTINRNYIGSRSYIKNDKYFRIDRYADGLEVFYSNVPQNLVNKANHILNSIFIELKNETSPPLDEKKRKIVTDSHYK